MYFNKSVVKQGIYLLLSLVLLLPTSAVYAQTAQEEFSSAKQLFEKGDYKRALRAFQHAQKMGIQGPAIEYNLGVTEYKLKHYTQAERHFSQLLSDKGMRPLAAYNIALINQELGREQQAKKYYRIAYDEASDNKLRTLAALALEQMGVKLGRGFKSGVDGIVGLQYGSDSNVISPTNPASNITDTFMEIYAGMFYRMSPSWKLNGFYLNQNYSVANTYDFQLLSLSLDKSFGMGPWQNKLGLLSTTTTLGGAAYENSVGGQYRGQVALSDTHDLSVRYRFEQISAPAALSYLQGTRQRIRIERVDHSNYGNRLMYEMEINNLANSATRSYSPTRQTLRYVRSFHLSDKWRLGGLVDYRTSSYSTVAGVTRQDQRLRFRARVRRSIGKHWQFVAEYTRSNNQSNVAGYTYNRDLSNLGVKATF